MSIPEDGAPKATTRVINCRAGRYILHEIPSDDPGVRARWERGLDILLELADEKRKRLSEEQPTPAEKGD